MFIDNISSKDNPRIKEILQLQEKSKERREKGLFIVEGQREITHCIEGGFLLEAIFFCEELFLQNFHDFQNSKSTQYPEAQLPHNLEELLANAISPKPSVFSISRSIYEKIAYRGSTEGIIAVVHSRSCELSNLTLCPTPFVLLFEGVEKPGNLGAILRTADAAGVDAVIFCDPLTDLYNPNLIRASLGGIFTVPTAVCSSEEALQWLRERHFTIYSAQLQDSKPYYDADMIGPTAIVFGTEATGLTPFWREAASSHILIPMLGRLDSLNVSVSAAVLCYEALRQRTDKQ